MAENEPDSETTSETVVQQDEPEVNDAVDKSDTIDINVTTNFDINEEGRVSKVTFASGEKEITAAITEADPAYYTYSSDTSGDDEGPVEGEMPMSLANVILAAYVELGLIPPHHFETIACRNKH